MCRYRGYVVRTRRRTSRRRIDRGWRMWSGKCGPRHVGNYLLICLIFVCLGFVSFFFSSHVHGTYFFFFFFSSSLLSLICLSACLIDGFALFWTEECLFFLSLVQEIYVFTWEIIGLMHEGLASYN